MKISANDIKSGNILEVDGQLWQVIKNPEHTKPGKGGAYVQVEMKNLLKKGTKKNTRFSSTDTVEKAFLEEVERQYLYQEGDFLVVMDPESFEQSMIPISLIAEKLPLLADGMIIKLDLYQDKPINLKLPANMEVEVEITAEVEVPPFDLKCFLVAIKMATFKHCSNVLFKF